MIRNLRRIKSKKGSPLIPQSFPRNTNNAKTRNPNYATMPERTVEKEIIHYSSDNDDQSSCSDFSSNQSLDLTRSNASQLDLQSLKDDADIMFSMAVQYHQVVKDIGKAKEYFLRALDAREKFYGPAHVEVASVHDRLGAIALQRESYKEALSHYRQSASVQQASFKHQADKQPHVAKTLHSLGHVQFLLHRDEEAIASFSQVLQILQHRERKPNYDAFSSSITYMVQIFKRRNDLDRAISWLNKKVTHIQTYIEYDHPDIPKTLHEMGCLYQKQYQYDKAIECHEQALCIYHDRIDDKNHIAMVNNCLGLCYSSVGNVTKSMASFKIVLDNTQSDIQKVTVLNCMGLSFMKTGRAEMAVKCYEEGLQIHSRLEDKKYREESKEEYEELGVLLYNNMGNVFFFMGMYDKVIECYRSAFELSVAKQEGDTDTYQENVTGALYNLGLVHMTCHSYRKATECFHESLEMMNALTNRNTNDDNTVKKDLNEATASSLNNLGNMHLKQGYHDEAVHLYKKALQLKEKIAGHDSPDILGTLSNLGTAHFHVNAHDRSIECFERCLRIMEMQEMPYKDKNDYLKVASFLNKLGNVHAKSNNHDMAMELYSNALQIRQNVESSDENSKDSLLIRHNIALIHCRKGEYSVAIPLLEQVYDMKKELYGSSNHPEVAKLLLDIGGVHLIMGNVENAREFAESAMAAFEKGKLPKNHHYRRQVMDHLKKIDEDLG